MQRLFSMFPAGRPGFAILVMRAALSLMLLEGVLGRFPASGSASAQVFVWVAATFLLVGLFTPIAAAACVLIEIVAWVAYGGNLEAVHSCALLSAVALALLGPGAYSLDARLFGRRRLVFPRGEGPDPD